MSANPQKHVFFNALKGHLKSGEIRQILNEPGPMNATKRMRVFAALASLEASDVEKERLETEKAVEVAQKQAKLELLRIENKYLDLKIKVLVESGYDHKTSEASDDDDDKSTTVISSMDTMDRCLMTDSSSASQSSGEDQEADNVEVPGMQEPAAKKKRVE